MGVSFTKENVQRLYCTHVLTALNPASNSYALFLYRFLNLRLVSWKVLHRVATCQEQVSRQSVDSDLVEICIQAEKLIRTIRQWHVARPLAGGGWGWGQFRSKLVGQKRVLTGTYKTWVLMKNFI